MLAIKSQWARRALTIFRLGRARALGYLFDGKQTLTQTLTKQVCVVTAAAYPGEPAKYEGRFAVRALPRARRKRHTRAHFTPHTHTPCTTGATRGHGIRH